MKNWRKDDYNNDDGRPRVLERLVSSMRLVAEITCKHCHKNFYYCGEKECPFCGKKIER